MFILSPSRINTAIRRENWYFELVKKGINILPYFTGNKCTTLRSYAQQEIQALSQRGELQGRYRGRSLVFRRKQWRFCQGISCQDRTCVRHEHQTWYFECSAAAVH